MSHSIEYLYIHCAFMLLSMYWPNVFCVDVNVQHRTSGTLTIHTREEPMCDIWITADLSYAWRLWRKTYIPLDRSTADWHFT